MKRKEIEVSPRIELLKLIGAFAATYLIWGSTYLSIRFAVESMPPFLMAGTRFLLAGTALYLLTRHRVPVRPGWRHWRNAAVISGFMLLGGNGLVSWAEQAVPSGFAALIISTVPLWMVLLEWLSAGRRPLLAEMAGILLGFTGVFLLVAPERGEVVLPFEPAATVALLAAALLWAIGSLKSRTLELPGSSFFSTAMQMLTGGALLFFTGLVTGEGAAVAGEISLHSVLALIYLIVFGSLVALSAYVWLLQATTPAKASTYAFVNPAVAVVLGWAFAHEPVHARTVLALGLITSAVSLVLIARARKKSALPAVEPARQKPDPIEQVQPE